MPIHIGRYSKYWPFQLIKNDQNCRFSAFRPKNSTFVDYRLSLSAEIEKWVNPVSFQHWLHRPSLPVDDLVLMEVLQPEHDARRVEDGPRLAEDVRVNVHHEVAARGVLHDEAHMRVRLEGARDRDRVDVERAVQRTYRVTVRSGNIFC